MSDEKQKRVLVVAPLRVGGVTSMMINIQKRINREQLNFDYLVFHDIKEPREDEVYAMGSKKLVASADDVKWQPKRFISRLLRIKRVCKENKVKVLHYNADTPMAVFNILAARAGGVKYVTIHSHNAGFEDRSNWLARFLCLGLKPLIPFVCNSYWGCSEKAAEFLLPSKVIKEKKYCVLKNGIELSKFKFQNEIREKIRKSLGVENNFVIGHAGRFSTQKNHIFLLKIFKHIYDIDAAAVLILFGVGELLNEIKSEANCLGISDRIIFYGASSEMEKMYMAMDVFVMPSLHEGLPVTGIEAQASGLPCVFADTITREVDITSTSKFLSLNMDVDIWAKNIMECKGKERVDSLKLLKQEGYDIEDTVHMVENFYLKIQD